MTSSARKYPIFCPAENAVNLTIQEGQRNCEDFFDELKETYASVARLPARIEGVDHSYDEYLVTQPVRLRAR